MYFVIIIAAIILSTSPNIGIHIIGDPRLKSEFYLVVKCIMPWLRFVCSRRYEAGHETFFPVVGGLIPHAEMDIVLVT